MFRRIAWQLTSSYIVVILFSMGILGFYMLRALEENFEQELYHGIRQQAQLLANTWAAYLEEGHVTTREKRKLAQLAQLLAFQNGGRFRVVNATGQVIVDTQAQVSDKPPAVMGNRLAVKQAMAGEENVGTEADAAEVYLAYPVRVRRPSLKDPSGVQDTVQGVVYVNRSTAYVRTTLQRLRGLFLVGTFISLLFSGTLSLFLSHYMSQPLREIAEAADKMAAGDLSIQLPIMRQNEIGELGERFNAMARELQASTGRLMEERNKLSVVLANMADGVLMMNADRKLVLSNASADAMLALTPADETPPLHVVRDGMRRALAAGDEAEDEVRLSGGRVARAIYSPVRSADGSEVVGCVALLHDITELRRLSELKTEFVSNVSHELKTPLASIKGLAEILLDGAAREPEGERFIRNIGREVDRMARLVKDLLNLSKIESGVVQMEVRPFDLAALVRDVAGGFQERVTAAGASLTVQSEEVWAEGDPDRVEQVVVNLLDNAVRYSPSDSRIDVRVYAESGMCRVDVQDQGGGVPQAELQRIFERFYRVDKARSRDQGGTGLGLSIARQIVERLHGRIWAESDGKGSRFSFTLPARAEEPAPTEEILAEGLEN